MSNRKHYMHTLYRMWYNICIYIYGIRSNAEIEAKKRRRATLTSSLEENKDSSDTSDVLYCNAARK